MIMTGINKAKSHNIIELRKSVPQNKDDNLIMFVHAYNSHHPKLFSIPANPVHNCNIVNHFHCTEICDKLRNDLYILTYIDLDVD